MSIRYRVVVDPDLGSHVAAIIDGELYSATDKHAGFQRIVEALGEGRSEAEILDLFDASRAVALRFENLSERVSIAGGNLYLDGDRVHNSLATLVLRFLDEGVEDWKPLVRFFEKVQENPNDHSREQLFDWLNVHDFTISQNGNIIGYKGVASTDTPGVYRSISAGPAIVNGESVNGHVHQKIGDVVTMPRSSVQHDPSVGCHTGLHVGTWDYASSFGPYTLTVEINPRDVVSVPTDCSWAKMRCCRYKVTGVTQSPFRSAYNEGDDDFDADYDADDWHI